MMTLTDVEREVDARIARLHAWLDTMRGPEGYAGPVVHWWRDCLIFCGPALDWRYEGIIAGYLTLYERTGNTAWLAQAQRAGDDLLRGQLPDGSYRDSCFELNPGPRGTPHEAAADIGLLLLARALRARGDDGWQQYTLAAERNLRGYYLDRLWSETEQRFGENVERSSFVPNKSSTLIEALALLVELTGREEYAHRYIRPTADAIVASQVRASGSAVDGAIAQISVGPPRYFPYYQARCVGGLLAARTLLGDDRYLDAALAAMRFVLRWRDADGALPQIVYPDGRVNRYPRWIAAVGDVLRAVDLLRPYGLDADVEPTRCWLLAGQLPGGGFRSADGLASRVSQRPATGLPDARDLLPVVGWTDKAFRYLAAQVVEPRADGVPEWGPPLAARYEHQAVEFAEDAQAIQFRRRGRVVYRWRKGDRWAVLRTGTSRAR